MKRRNLILSALMAIPVVSFARFNFLKKDKPLITAIKGFVIRADESRFQGEQKKLGDDQLRCVISCEDSNSGLLIGTTTSKSLAGKGGPPLHLHEHQDEIMYVASGEFLVQIGEEVMTVKTGDAAFIPGGTHHTFANPVANNPGTLISIFQPGNKQMEADFKTIAAGNFPKSWENDPTRPANQTGLNSCSNI